MIIFPAIDIKKGKVVRLLQGRFDKVTEYSAEPVMIAKEWVRQGAQWIHVVDLDGAQSEEIKNFNTIFQIAQTIDVPIQMGGGIRTKEDITRLLEAGVSRVILGTKAVSDRNFLRDALALWPEKIVVSLDCSNGMVTQKGWTDVTNLKAPDFAKELEDLGLRYLVYTDIKRDGTLAGPNYEALTELLDSTNISVIASGGVSSIEDIQKLCALETKGVIGAITGKALYEGTLNLEDAIKLCLQNG